MPSTAGTQSGTGRFCTGQWSYPGLCFRYLDAKVQGVIHGEVHAIVDTEGKKEKPKEEPTEEQTEETEREEGQNHENQ